MTSNMNGKCRDLVTGKPDASKPGGIEAQTRDRIDKQAIQWIDSIVSSHSDAECITNATKWPSGPGGWGLSIEDAHTALTQGFLPRADLVLFVTSAERPFSQSEQELLRAVADWRKPVLCVLNKADLLDAEQLHTVTEYVAEQVWLEP